MPPRYAGGTGSDEQREKQYDAVKFFHYRNLSIDQSYDVTGIWRIPAKNNDPCGMLRPLL
jgi:hypothetical protein